MKITYLLPGIHLCGGIKIVFSQVNGLIEKGHHVQVLSPVKNQDWFPLKTKIKKVKDFKSIPASDVVVATYNPTAFAAARIKEGIPFYLVQGYETPFETSPLLQKRTEASYLLPLNIISVSTYLKELLFDRFRRRAQVVPNGISLERPYFKSTEQLRILMTYSSLPSKAPEVGLAALREVKSKYPEVEILLFGQQDRPQADFSFTYIKDPPQDKLLEIYGQSHIFLSSSKQEGFSLPVLEAMASKCAVVTTDSGGVREMAKDEETVLMVKPGDFKGLASKVIELIENREKRERVAVSGLKKAKEFSLKRMVDRLETLFLEAKESCDGKERRDWLAWEKALLLCPDDPYANYMLGVALLKRGQIRKAKEKLKQTVSCSPDFDLPYYKLGQLYFEQKDYYQARQNLEKALEINPELKMAKRFLDRIPPTSGKRKLKIICLKMGGPVVPVVSQDCLWGLGELGHKASLFTLRESENYAKKSLLLEIEREKPDFLFCLNYLPFLKEVAELKKIPCILWFIENPFWWLTKETVSPYFHIFLWDRFYLEKVRTLGFKNVHWLPMATNSSVFKKLTLKSEEKARFESLISFVGDSIFPHYQRHYLSLNDQRVKGLAARIIEIQAKDPERDIKRILEETAREMDISFSFDALGPGQRQHLLLDLENAASSMYRKEMVEELSPLGICVYGDVGWEKLLRQKIDFRGYISNRTELPLVFNASEINLNISKIQLKTTLGMRVFDCLACGGFLLSDWREDFEKLFAPGIEVAIFKNKKELLELATYFLKDSKLRLEMAAAGQRRALSDHTYKKRMKEMLGMIS